MHETRPARAARWCDRAPLACALALSILGSPLPGAAQPAPTVTDHVVASFDGTPLEVTLFVPASASEANPVPLVLRGHGFGEHRQRTLQGEAGGFNAIADPGFTAMVPALVDAGYAVLTWDARGFGCSGGEAQVNDPEVEGRDVSALIDWAVQHAPLRLDADGDPVVGMTGESYGGGVQLAAASLDPRIDAIAPTMSWSDLEHGAFPDEIAKVFFSSLIVAAGTLTAGGEGYDPRCQTWPQTGSLDPTLATLGGQAIATDSVSGELRDYFAVRSLNSYGVSDPVPIPTLVIQGSTDTLFPIRQAIDIYEHVEAQGAPVKLLATCGGHGACSPQYVGGSDLDHVFDAVVRWFDRYLGDDPSVDVGSPVEFHSNTGAWIELDGVEPIATLGHSVTGQLLTVPVSDPADPIPFFTALLLEGVVDASASPFTAAQVSASDDPRALTVPLLQAGAEELRLFGLPKVQLTVSGVGGPTANLFVKFLDREAQEIVNLQEGVVRVPVGGEPVIVDVDMPGVAYSLPAGHRLDLQIATHTNVHAMSRYASTLDVTAEVDLPVVSLPEPGPMATWLGALPLLSWLRGRRTIRCGRPGAGDDAARPRRRS